jgi:CRISPR-associated protein Cmr5
MTTDATPGRASDAQAATLSRRRSLEQQRAQAAWEAVARVKGRDYATEYRALAMSAPSDMQVNGLGQTLAFWHAKGKDKINTSEHARLFADVSDWVRGRLGVRDADHLLTWITETATTNDYRRATVEAMALLAWTKRFAEAELPSRETGAPR